VLCEEFRKHQPLVEQDMTLNLEFRSIVSTEDVYSALNFDLNLTTIFVMV